ncbi:MAG: TIR domain-containing protein [Leadbetterella sp.]
MKFRLFWANENAKTKANSLGKTNEPNEKNESEITELQLWQQIINEYVFAKKYEDNSAEKYILDLGNCNLGNRDGEINSIQMYINQTIYDLKQKMGITPNIEDNISIKSCIKHLSLGKDFYKSETLRINTTNYLGDNNFTELPNWDLPNLETLQIRNSKIEKIHPMYSFNETLIELDLTFNLISDSTPFLQFKNLIELSLHGNKLSDFTAIDPSLNPVYPKLKILYLGANSLQKFDFIGSLPTIEDVHLYNNQITEIPNFEKIESNITVRLTNNKISSIKGKCKKNVTLELVQNPIIDIPQPILASNDWNEIYNFFYNNNEKSSNTANYVKVFIVGHNEETRAALSKNIYPDHSSDKQHLEFLYLEKKNSPDTYLKLFTLSDTSINSNLHEYFLDADSIIIILWNENYNHVQYWLETIYNIENYGPETKIFILYINEENKLSNNAFRTNFSSFAGISFQNFLHLHLNKLHEDHNLEYFRSFLKKEIEDKTGNRNPLHLEYYNTRNLVKKSKSKKVNSIGGNLAIDKLLESASHIVITPKRIYQDINHFIHTFNEETSKIKNETVDSDFLQKSEFISILKKCGLLIQANSADICYSVNNLKATNPFDTVLDMLSIYAFKTRFCYRVSSYYASKLFNFLLYKIQFDTNFTIKSVWKNGFLLTSKLNLSETDQYSILIKFQGFNQNAEFTEIFINVEDKKQNNSIYQTITSWINTFSLTNLKGLIENSTSLATITEKNDNSDTYFQENLLISCTEPPTFYKFKEVVSDSTNKNNLNFSGFSNYLTDVKLSQKTKKVFISYSHNNTQWMNKLKVHLGGFVQQKRIEVWDDTSILPGDRWDAEIQQQLEQADIFILMLTADFVNSKYIMSKELADAYKNMHSRQAILIPILVEPFYKGSIPIIEGEKLSNFEMLPKNHDQKLQAISLWENENEAFSNIMERLDTHLKQ